MTGKAPYILYICNYCDFLNNVPFYCQFGIGTLLFSMKRCNGFCTTNPTSAFSVEDAGQTVALGDYEASVDAMLYEFDPQARRRMRRREIGADATFGGSLRRLRIHKGLRRSDFAPISAKSIARIERGEIEAPRGATIAVIAKRLGVRPDQIKSF